MYRAYKFDVRLNSHLRNFTAECAIFCYEDFIFVEKYMRGVCFVIHVCYLHDVISHEKLCQALSHIFSITLNINRIVIVKYTLTN